jgi:hypothetical protein
MIKKIITALVFISAIITGLYFLFNYKASENNDLYKFSDLVTISADTTSATASQTTIKGIVASNKPIEGQIFFDSTATTINGTSFGPMQLSPGYYTVTVQDSSGKSYLTSPTSVQVFPGNNELQINIFN